MIREKTHQGLREKSSPFNESKVLDNLRHYLPSQAPLRNFVHHNTLHAFQEHEFFEACKRSSVIFGNRTSLSLDEYRSRYEEGKIPTHTLEAVLKDLYPESEREKWRRKAFEVQERPSTDPRIGKFHRKWKEEHGIDMDVLVLPDLFKLIGGYLDQGVSVSSVYRNGQNFLEYVRELQENSMIPILKSQTAKRLLAEREADLSAALSMLVADEHEYEHYLFDQQFGHPGWSGMVAVLESQGHFLFKPRPITLNHFIYVELLMEIDALERFLSGNYHPLRCQAPKEEEGLFEDIPNDDYWEVVRIWQETFEWSYHDQVLAALNSEDPQCQPAMDLSYQALFCIDDREESLRRHLEMFEKKAETFGCPGHFNILAMYRPKDGKHLSQICPANAKPKHLIKEKTRQEKRNRHHHLEHHSHGLAGGFTLAHTIGIWSAIKLLLEVFRPGPSMAHSSSFEHLDESADLELKAVGEVEDGLQLGFYLEEMVDIIHGQLASIGLLEGFAPIIYVIGHGASSTNNPYFAGYNCGACAGMPGSVNARAFCSMANYPEVRAELAKKGINIPDSTHFVPGLHDTTKDEVVYYGEDEIPVEHRESHENFKVKMDQALDHNAKERARQFQTIEVRNKNAASVHRVVRDRAFALYEPRPELNHSNNTLCIVGERGLTGNIFLDQRAFLNSYVAELDMDGKYLSLILGAATPVCGGINLEYYFSRTDNNRLGAGSKLPHNVVGLFGVTNGIKGDLRTGLPSQMIDVHDPMRLLMVVQQSPHVVEKVLDKAPEVKEWYDNGWVKLAVMDPNSGTCFTYRNGKFLPYEPMQVVKQPKTSIDEVMETSRENLPVYLLKEQS